jgi:DNA sulfur modification protein DndB
MPETYEFVTVRQKSRSFLLARLPASLVALISYASVRGRDDEPGAVQRYLNQARIASIKAFTIGVGDFPTSIVLNWVNQRDPLIKSGGRLSIPEVPRSAQIIDGQHRVAGIKAAIQEDQGIQALELPVALYEGLPTRECADIFLSINTEQKPVPRSLVYDLYGIASEILIDRAAERARDIATALNETKDSPYYEFIKFPGSPRTRGGIALSTLVNAIKPLVEDKGIFEQIGVPELESQKKILFNFFKALRQLYSDKWYDKSNAFLYAAGFTGAIEFLKNKLIVYCNTRRDFTTEAMTEALSLNESNLILQEDIKGLGGKDAPKRILERLVEVFSPVGAVSGSVRI